MSHHHAVGQIVPIHQSPLNNEPTPTVNARDLHKALAVGRDFSNWIKGRISECGFVENEDFSVERCSPNSANGNFSNLRTSIEYRITLDMAKHLAMLEKNPTGHKVRQSFIDYEKNTRAMLSTVPTLPTNPMQLLKLTYEALEETNSRVDDIAHQLKELGREVAMNDTILEAVERVAVQSYERLEALEASRPLEAWQAYEIKQHVNSKVEYFATQYRIPRPILYSAVWGFLKRHFKVPTYIGIPAQRYEEASTVVFNLTLEQLPESIMEMARKRKAAPPARKAKPRKMAAKGVRS